MRSSFRSTLYAFLSRSCHFHNHQSFKSFSPYFIDEKLLDEGVLDADSRSNQDLMDQGLLNRDVNYKAYNHGLDSPHRAVSRYSGFSYPVVPLADMISPNPSATNGPTIASLLRYAQNSPAILSNDLSLRTHQDYNRIWGIPLYRHCTQDSTASSVIVP